ncbi:hypothetical protein F4810DRAFT_712850 [Camillea tinctor]|nr:hypothetical protein F4810DRAFT_712850 [Camillea tinctor]
MLENLKPVLKPDDMLLLTEISTTARASNYTFGNFSKWWLGGRDDRLWEPYILPGHRDKELEASRFTKVEAVVSDDEMSYQLFIAILSKPRPIEKNKKPGRKVTVLYWRNQLPSSGGGIIAHVDLNTRFFDRDMSEAGLSTFQDLLPYFKDERILGMAHIIRPEPALRFFALEMDYDEELQAANIVS